MFHNLFAGHNLLIFCGRSLAPRSQLAEDTPRNSATIACGAGIACGPGCNAETCAFKVNSPPKKEKVKASTRMLTRVVGGDTSV